MKYTIYIDIDKGYKVLENNLNYDNMIQVLDYLILSKNTNGRILVIEHNIVNGYDIPLFMYNGDTEDYLDFKVKQTLIKK